MLSDLWTDGTLVCYHLKESYRAVLSCGAVCCAVEFCSTHSNKSYRTVLSCGTVCYAVRGCSVDETLVCGH